jgi:hypothetical protein
VAGFVVATARLLYSGPGWALSMNWGWVEIGMMGIGKNGVAAPDRTRIEPDAGHQLSPAILVVASFACAMVAALIGSMLSDPTVSATEYNVRLTGSGLSAEGPPQHR